MTWRCGTISFLKDEGGQGAAEYILLFGGVIIIAVIALFIYKQYFQGTNLSSSTDSGNLRSSLAA